MRPPQPPRIQEYPSHFLCTQTCRASNPWPLEGPRSPVMMSLDVVLIGDLLSVQLSSLQARLTYTRTSDLNIHLLAELEYGESASAQFDQPSWCWFNRCVVRSEVPELQIPGWTSEVRPNKIRILNPSSTERAGRAATVPNGMSAPAARCSSA
jgi:hypothetical protein